MSLPSAIAGPSRIPLKNARVTGRVARTLRAYATAPATTSSSSSFAEVEGNKFGRERGAPRLEGGYDNWMLKVGLTYQTPKKGAKARWLGGEVPFPSNPSFRPPPPVSNDLQNVIAKELRSPERTVGQIAQAHSVSKARIEAVRKLKLVEAEFRRQGLPLQEAFQDGMETLLGVNSPYDQKTKSINMESSRVEEMRRRAHPGSIAELDEEQRFEDGIGAGGAFGNLQLQSQKEGLEKDIWEFKDEETIVSEKAAKIAKASEKIVSDDAKSQPEAIGISTPAKPTKKSLPSTVVTPGKTTYRFIDTSSGSRK